MSDFGCGVWVGVVWGGGGEVLGGRRLQRADRGGRGGHTSALNLMGVEVLSFHLTYLSLKTFSFRMPIQDLSFETIFFLPIPVKKIIQMYF